jgi:hypothetical protein
MLLGLPLLGVLTAGYPVARYLEFPPRTRYVAHAPFSWLAFALIAFSLLWFSYIIVINAVCQARTGHCLMTDRPGFFLLLFPVSAAFWWFFEFLKCRFWAMQDTCPLVWNVR